MADYLYDWGDDSKGWIGKTLKQMWHEERGAVVWACENFDKLRDTPWGPDFYDAVAEVGLMSQSGRLKKQDSGQLELIQSLAVIAHQALWL
jgi:hypothetical protein